MQNGDARKSKPTLLEIVGISTTAADERSEVGTRLANSEDREGLTDVRRTTRKREHEEAAEEDRELRDQMADVSDRVNAMHGQIATLKLRIKACEKTLC